MSWSYASRLVRVTTVLSVLGLVSVSYLASAAPRSAAPLAPGLRQVGYGQSMARLQERYFHLSLILNRIKAKALELDTKLVKEQKAYSKQVIAVMEKNGSHPRARMHALRRIGQQMQSRSTAAIKRQELYRKGLRIRARLLHAEHQALRDPKLLAARRKLRRATLVAMRRANPRAKELIAQMHSVEQRIGELSRRG